jgi:hypothetical protein
VLSAPGQAALSRAGFLPVGTTTAAR